MFECKEFINDVLYSTWLDPETDEAEGEFPLYQFLREYKYLSQRLYVASKVLIV